MLTVRLQIANGAVVDTQQYGFIYIDSDKRVGVESKGFESTSYPEEEGEHIIPKTVDSAFDYKVKFFVQADSVENANDKIDAFNEMLYTKDATTGVKTYNQVTVDYQSE